VVFPLLQQDEEELSNFEHDPQEYIRRMQGTEGEIDMDMRV
jgi:hypothetical protein